MSSALGRLGLPDTSSRIAVGVVAVFVVGSAASIDVSGAVLIGAKGWVVDHLDWLFVGTASLSLVGIVGVGLSPLGRVRLGMDGDEREFGNLAWFAMLLSAGLASGLLYWATAEPVLHFQANPLLEPAGIEAASEAAVPSALRITIFHWGLHGWAFYVVIALAIGIQSHRHARPMTFRIGLFPLLGERNIDRWPGKLVDLLALFGTVCGVATSIGLAAAGMNASLAELFGLGVSTTHQVAIVLFVCALGSASALSGVARGVRRLSELNVWISLLLLLAVALLGPTLHLAGLLLSTLADYAGSALSLGAWVGATEAEQSWQADWTIFYWGWWLAWAPFVGLFIARISKGRSVREVVVGVLLVPALAIVVWMTIFGGTALHQELAETGAVSVAVNQDYSLGFVALIGNLGSPALETPLVAVAAFLLFTWMITSLDSATLVLCMLLGAEGAAPAKIFWGASLAAVTCVLMLVGGVSALQAASIVVGLPLAIVILLAGAGLVLELTGRGR